MKCMPASQSGVVLLEALIGILIFSLGVLSLVAMSTSAVRVQGDAEYRAEAMNLAEQMASTIWSSVDRPQQTVNDRLTAVVNSATLNNYQHQPGGTLCAYSGSTSTQGLVTIWLTKVQNTLPGSASGMQQIVVTPANSNQVRITLCWQAPSDSNVRHHTLVTYVN